VIARTAPLRFPMPWLSIAAVLCAVAVGAGAFGAHALRERLDPRSLEVWETAARYLMYVGLALLAVAIARRQPTSLPAGSLQGAAWALFAGAVIFSGSLFCLALGGPRWLGAMTPLGGLSIIVGFALLALWGLRG
jgi:uncharacterized membrane protein YgdD (TMEM256/DUF423 family)